MPEKPKILSSTEIARSRHFCIESLDLEFSNGERRIFERLCRSAPGGAVLIVPLLDHSTVLLIREYAAGVGRYELGLPKGKRDADEDRLQAANRELQEEVGYAARDLHLLTVLTVAPGYLEHETDIILARDLYPHRLPGDEPEELEVVPWSLDDIGGLLKSGEMTEARSLAALYLTRDFLQQV